MQVLPREFDALDTSMASLDGIGNSVRLCHPESVRRILEPLSVEGPELGCTEALRRRAIALVVRSRARFSEPLPFGE